ncbi:hypothetical protein MRX96_036159 [Rhipicephalus microplus]
MSMLRSHAGHWSKLSHAQRFFLVLSDLRLHALCVDGMLQVEELTPSTYTLKPQLDDYVGVCQKMLTNHCPSEFLELTHITGNVINSVNKR